MIGKCLRTISLAFIVLIISSCIGYQKLLKSSDYGEKYEMGIDYFNQGDYYRALELFETVLPFYRGSEQAENLNYYYAYCHFHQRDYELASHYFKRFAKNFPNSKYTEECQFMSAYCKYMLSPAYSLDQTNTMEAINELQLFIDLYPKSERIAECNDLIDRLREKLERKAFGIAKLYLKMENYNAAITAFNNVLKDFPGTDYKEEIMFSLAKAYYLYAENSIDEKKKERHQSAIEAYDAFVTAYPESDYLKQVNNFSKNSRRQVKN